MHYFPLLRPVLHALPPEAAHRLAVRALQWGLLPASRAPVPASLATDAFGLHFPSPVGLAAGFDKNAEAVDGLLAQGFGFVEAGTCTPRPQAGNPKPRLFRLRQDGAVINRLGFNNRGKEAFVAHLRARRRAGVVGANIGKNKDSEDAIADYVTMLEAVAAHADYVTVNISSPNTEGLRALQERESLDALLGALASSRARLAEAQGRRVPLLLKIAPDLDGAQQEAIAEVALARGMDGLIISNTTVARPQSLKDGNARQAGGLSGTPLFAPSTELLRAMYRLTQGRIPLVGVGGIGSGADAYAKIRAGASLVQLYSALVYQGFGLVGAIHAQLAQCLARDGFVSVQQAVGADATR